MIYLNEVMKRIDCNIIWEQAFRIGGIQSGYGKSCIKEREVLVFRFLF